MPGIEGIPFFFLTCVCVILVVRLETLVVLERLLKLFPQGRICLGSREFMFGYKSVVAFIGETKRNSVTYGEVE